MAEDTRSAEFSRRDAVIAGLGALLTLGVYLATMYPGIHSRGDATKFAFVGKVLGTPHAPGYPLYMLVSHAFSYVPVGTLAYRMNLLSALLGVAAVVLVYFTARRLGTSRIAATSSMLALGFGQAFWSRSLYAKGYTLNAALVAAGILLLLEWGESRKRSHFYWAAAVFALSAGNHLIVVALVPALVLYALLVDVRATLRIRTLLTVGAFVVLGLCQYSYILIRTWQNAPYTEARAQNLRELWAVMTARRFAHEIGAFSWSDLVSERLPAIGRLMAGEFGPAGLLLVLVGLIVLIVARRREAVLLGVGALGVAALTTNMSSQEDEGFLLPAFVLLWPVAAVGIDGIVRGLHRAPRPLAAGAAVVLAALVPAHQIARNYRVNDHHAETSETEYFNALFAVLPEKAAIINDEYHLNQIIHYKLLGERAAGPRSIRLVDSNRSAVGRVYEEGFQVLAFEQGRRELSAAGYRFVPYRFPVTGAAAVVAEKREMFRLVTAGACLDIGNLGWLDIAPDLRPKGRMTVRIDNYRTFDSTVTVYAGTDRAHLPALVGHTGVGTPVLKVETFPQDDAGRRQALLARAAEDGVALSAALIGMPVVTRAQIDVSDRGAFSLFGLDLGQGARAVSVRATVDLNNPKRATLCSHPLGDVDVWPPGEAQATISPESSEIEFAEGFYPVERRLDGLLFRWTTGRAFMVVPIDVPRAATLRIMVEPLIYPGRSSGSVTLVINGQRIGTRPLALERAAVAWHVPVESWRAGLNEITFETDDARRPSEVGLAADNRLLGLSISEIAIVENK